MFPSWSSIRDFFVKYWWIILVVIACIALYGWHKRSNEVPIATIPTVTENSVGKAMESVRQQATQQEIHYVTEKIIERAQSEPDIVYVTKTEKQADAQAQELAKQEKVDYVFKNPTDKYTSNYYAVHTEKNHKIKAGVTVVEDKVYASVGYQDKKNELILHVKDSEVKGGTYMRTIKEW